jgi:hypothetical protein
MELVERYLTVDEHQQAQIRVEGAVGRFLCSH